MRPLFKPGGWVLIKGCSVYRCGDTVFYNRQGKKYIHRIIRKKDKKFTVADDAGIGKYHRIDLKNIEGKVEKQFITGFLGVIYCISSRVIFKILRRLKKFL